MSLWPTELDWLRQHRGYRGADIDGNQYLHDDEERPVPGRLRRWTVAFGFCLDGSKRYPYPQPRLWPARRPV